MTCVYFLVFQNVFYPKPKCVDPFKLEQLCLCERLLMRVDEYWCSDSGRVVCHATFPPIWPCRLALC